ncbi:BTAD domain-containing putative transcriptional regulator [Spongiactinospora sp. 9N601]|uniref:AfsR/SARP family transcriptional regulator n=1 Tax=Spongiactinospora sp. 9N601 TaxID=3375149 RepID=UPI0037A0F2A8
MGPLEVQGQGGEIQIGSARERAILTALVLHANRVVSVERLIEVVWVEDVPRSARGQIAICVSRLRKALGDASGAVVTCSPGYLVRAAPETIDWLRFQDMVARARAAAASGDGEGAVALLRGALALWRGNASEDMPGLRYEMDRLEESRLEAIELCLDLELDLGLYHRVIAELGPIVARYPLHERARAQLMLAQYRSGRRAEALCTYLDARRDLIEQIGLEPGPELRHLHDRILRDEAGLMPSARSSPA